MIVTRSPYRISFFGGGTDYHEWFSENKGSFLSLAVNYYTYITLRVKPSFQEKEYRVLWRYAEEVNSIKDIRHPIVRETLKHLKFDRGLDISYIGDLPGGSGIGSSSAFTAALIFALYSQINKKINPYELAYESYNIEKNKLKETVGIQDQIATSFGGFNYVNIEKDSSYSLSKVNLTSENQDIFLNSLLLVYTGKTRRASDIAEEKVKGIKKKYSSVMEMQNMTPLGFQYLNNMDLENFGRLLSESWGLKRSLSKSISSSEIDDLYKFGIKEGAIGGKLLGAGGGGFMLFVCKEGMKENLISKLNGRVIVPFKISDSGTKLVYKEEPLT